MKYTICGVARNKEQSVFVKIAVEKRLRELSTDVIREFIEWFAEGDYVWQEVLNCKAEAVFYDEETFENVVFSKGRFWWSL